MARRARAAVAVAAGLLGLSVVTGCASGAQRHEPSSRSGSRPTTTAGTRSNAALADPSGAARVLSDAHRDLVAVHTYSYRSRKADRSAASAATTGAYRTTIDRRIVDWEHDQPHQGYSPTVAVGLGSVTGDQALVLAVGRIAYPGQTEVDPLVEVENLRLVGGRWRLSGESLEGHIAGSPGGTTGLQAALGAARGGVRALLTYAPATLSADTAATLTHLTGRSRHDFVTQTVPQRRKTIASVHLTRCVGSVPALGVISAADTTVTLLVRGVVTCTAGGMSEPSNLPVRLTVVEVHGRWLLSDLQAVPTH